MTSDECLLQLMTELAKENPSRVDVRTLINALDFSITHDKPLPVVHGQASPDCFQVGE